MLVELSPEELRIIGVLLEKEITTPDQYPLSLNALTVGCNQKSNREPVMQLTEVDVQSCLDSLKSKRQIIEDTFGSRVTKYKHKFCNTEFGSLKFSEQQTAIICLLFLRGPQTPGEIRTRSNRLAQFANIEEVEAALDSLADFNGDQLVLRLPREPGKRESRYAQCFGTEIDKTVVQATSEALGQSDSTTTSVEHRVIQLEETVSILLQKVAQLEATMNPNDD